jgi:hypothetical protein
MLAQQHVARPRVALRRREPARNPRHGAGAVRASGCRGRTRSKRYPGALPALLRGVCFAALGTVETCGTAVLVSATGSAAARDSGVCSGSAVACRTGGTSGAGSARAARSPGRAAAVAAAARSGSAARPSPTAAVARIVVSAFAPAGGDDRRRTPQYGQLATTTHELSKATHTDLNLAGSRLEENSTLVRSSST